jgi:hypothetical protein
VKDGYLIVRCGNDLAAKCESVIVAPEEALVEPWCLKTMTIHSAAQSKHEFHGMAQIALSRFQERELDVETVIGQLTVEWKDAAVTMDAGIAILLGPGGEIRLLSNSDGKMNRLLQVIHRWCTRWIRLDI